jgi:FtsZ-binding cell division protein ZapB
VVSFEAGRRREVAVLKSKISDLEGENVNLKRNQVSLQNNLQAKINALGEENVDLKRNQVSLQNNLQSRESELKDQQGIIPLSL